MKLKCDVIIPIYNAYDALVECVDSVLKNTDLKFHSLVLVNDCSTDERISSYLRKVKKENKGLNIVILNNGENLGFIGTVNYGMSYSSNDVLLLNSDTVVCKGWLEKIQDCAYSQEKVATVTPLSNNATLVSVPRGLQKNEILEDITIDQYNEIIDRCSFHDYPELPTGHGFCMYIRREVLEIVGYFDIDTFERGYGEENDFCFRCLDYGYRNLLCDDVLIYHKESQSFSSERQKVIDNHMKKLENRYPEYVSLLNNWCQRFPIEYICKNIDYYMNIRKRANILIVVHDWETNTGGTTLHVKDIVFNLKDRYNFHILYPCDEGYVVRSYFDNGEQKLHFSGVDKFGKLSRYNNSYQLMFEDIVLALGIDVVHVHHMVGHYFDLISVMNKYNIYSVITLHDFYCLCPSINMLYCNEKYCMNLDKQDCLTCLSRTRKIDNNIIPNWREDWRKFLEKFDKVIVPSEDTKKRILEIYSDLEIDDIEHGIDLVKNDYDICLRDTFNVAFIGVMCNHKGGNVLKKLLSKKLDAKIHFHVFGSSELPELCKNQKNYTYHGRYQRSELSNLLKKNEINLICFFQIWPETYSYTLNEAVAAGIPVLSFDIGAGAERVKKHHLGWVIDVNSSVNQIVKKLDEIASNKEEYNKMISCVKNYEIKTTVEMASEYDIIYGDSITLKKEVDVDRLHKIIREESVNKATNTSEQLNAILNSTKWRLVNKIKFSPKFVGVVRKIMARRRK